MKMRFATQELERLYTDRSFTNGLPPEVVKQFRRRCQFIRSATDERTFYSMNSLHFKKLKGKRAHQRSMRLNDQWRLILEIEAGEPTNTTVLISVEDYHD